jgi:hypothetical protein
MSEEDFPIGSAEESDKTHGIADHRNSLRSTERIEALAPRSHRIGKSFGWFISIIPVDDASIFCRKNGASPLWRVPIERMLPSANDDSESTSDLSTSS